MRSMDVRVQRPVRRWPWEAKTWHGAHSQRSVGSLGVRRHSARASMLHVAPAAAHMRAGPRGPNHQNASSGAQANRPRYGGVCGWSHAKRPNRRQANAAKCSSLTTHREVKISLRMRVRLTINQTAKRRIHTAAVVKQSCWKC